MAQPLPGLHLVVEAAGLEALVPADLVEEVVRLVAFSHVPAARGRVAGSFLHRGERVVAVDLAACLGAAREPDLDAHIVVLRTARRVGLLVDAVRALVDHALLLPSGTPERGADRWRASGLVAALAQVGGGPALPLLGLTPLLALAQGEHEMPDGMARAGEERR